MSTIELPSDMVGKLLQHQRELNDFQQELDKAEFCGVDCSQLRAAMAEANERISRLLANYGPQS